MSERDVAGVSAETLLVDAEAVLAAAKLDRFIVMQTPEVSWRSQRAFALQSRIQSA